jgi:hypothetical protein
MADTWHIVHQEQRTVLAAGPTGFAQVWEIQVHVDSGPALGHDITVEVPSERHNAEYVRGAIDAKVNNLNEIAAL